MFIKNGILNTDGYRNKIQSTLKKKKTKSAKSLNTKY